MNKECLTIESERVLIGDVVVCGNEEMVAKWAKGFNFK